MARIRIPRNATREVVVGLDAGIARSDELRAQGYRVEERLDRVGGERVVRLAYWK